MPIVGLPIKEIAAVVDTFRTSLIKKDKEVIWSQELNPTPPPKP